MSSPISRAIPPSEVATTESPATAPHEAAVAAVTAAARLLYANGLTTQRTIDNVERLGRAFGLSVSMLPAWGEIVLRIEGEAIPGRLRVETLVAAPAGVEMNKVTRTLDVVDAAAAGRMDAAQALATLEAIGHVAPVSLVRLATMTAAGAAALAIIFGASDPLTLGITAFSAGAGAVLRRGLSHVSSNFLAQPLCAALLAGIIGALASRLLPSADPYLIALCPCMVLVPGPHLLNSALDLSRLRIALGMARFGFASLVILLICTGLIAGLSLGEESLPPPGRSIPVPLLYDVLAAGVAVAAYGTFFSMPWRTLAIPIAIGMLAHASRWLVLADGANLATGAFIACLIVGTIVTPVANRLRLPFSAVAFASVVSLIPGVFLFRLAAGLVEIMNAGEAASPTLLMPLVVDGTTAAVILLAMAFGLILPKMMLEHYFPTWSGVIPASAR